MQSQETAKYHKRRYHHSVPSITSTDEADIM